jgi:hypothetical protein
LLLLSAGSSSESLDPSVHIKTAADQGFEDAFRTLAIHLGHDVIHAVGQFVDIIIIDAGLGKEFIHTAKTSPVGTFQAQAFADPLTVFKASRENDCYIFFTHYTFSHSVQFSFSFWQPLWLKLNDRQQWDPSSLLVSYPGPAAENASSESGADIGR